MQKNDLFAIFVGLVGFGLLLLLKLSSLVLFMVLLAIWTLFWSWVYEQCRD